MSDKYLKSHQYYIDLYDKHTVERCRGIEKIHKEKESQKDDKVSPEVQVGVQKMCLELHKYFVTGERYINKEKTFKEWMDADRNKDELYESAQAPEDMRCLTCRNRLKPSSKNMWPSTDKGDRVLFMYDCPNKCLPRRAFFSDGEEWRPSPNLCPNCTTPLDDTTKDNGEKLITTYTCPNCKYTETKEYEWIHKKEEEIDENFAKDRDRFCLTEEAGKKYQDEKWRLEQMGKFMDEWKEEEKRREEKLKANPKGFHLEGKGYTCFICGSGTPEGDNWYDEWGIKCLTCQWAIDNNEIPATLAKDKDSWYSKFDIEYHFNIKGATLRKWIKDGIIKARTLSCYGKGIHFQLFLIDDNKDFLPPKKLVDSRVVTERKDGVDWSHSEKWYKFVDPHEHLKGYKIMNYLKVIQDKEESKSK